MNVEAGSGERGMPSTLDHFRPDEYSPYHFFSSEEWSKFRADTPLTLSADEVKRLRSLDDPIDLDEVRRIYLSLSRLLSSHVEASQLLFEQRNRFLNMADVNKTPFVIGIAGSVAVGKSTTARILKELLARWPSSPKVDLITTDGFLYPNEVLRRENLMERKGFPESYDIGALLRFLSAIKAGQPNVKAPRYSHLTYDVLPNEFTVIDQPDILIFEGINVLQSRDLPAGGRIVPIVSDFFDFSIYIDADEGLIHNWYVNRFMNLRKTAFRDPNSYFPRYASITSGTIIGRRRSDWFTQRPMVRRTTCDSACWSRTPDFAASARAAAIFGLTSSKTRSSSANPRAWISGPEITLPVAASTTTMTEMNPSSPRMRRSFRSASVISPTVDPSTYTKPRSSWPTAYASPSLRSMTVPFSASRVRSGAIPVSCARRAFAIRWRYSPWTGSTLRGLRML